MLAYFWFLSFALRPPRYQKISEEAVKNPIKIGKNRGLWWFRGPLGGDLGPSSRLKHTNGVQRVMSHGWGCYLGAPK